MRHYRCRDGHGSERRNTCRGGFLVRATFENRNIGTIYQQGPACVIRRHGAVDHEIAATDRLELGFARAVELTVQFVGGIGIFDFTGREQFLVLRYGRHQSVSCNRVIIVSRENILA